jgi:hypothetical protein
MIRSRVILLLAGWLSACGTASLDGSNSMTVSVDSALSVEAAYATVLRSMRACYNSASIRVEADYFVGSQQGDIRLSWFNSAGLIELMRVQVAPSAAGSTLKHTTRKNADQLRSAFDGWIRGKTDSCPNA